VKACTGMGFKQGAQAQSAGSQSGNMHRRVSMSKCAGTGRRPAEQDHAEAWRCSVHSVRAGREQTRRGRGVCKHGDLGLRETAVGGVRH
jgi:hypothetical protein